MIRPKLEYAAVVWSPHKKNNIRKLERIQRAATKMLPELREIWCRGGNGEGVQTRGHMIKIKKTRCLGDVKRVQLPP